MQRQSFLFEPEAGPGAAAIAKVVVHLPVDGTFDYRLPAHLAGFVVPGVRVLVGFGGRRVEATCIGLSACSEVQDPREVLAAIDREPLLSPALLELTRWIAGRYQCGWWEAIASALPAAARRGGGSRRILMVRLATAAGAAALLAEELLGRRPGQARCLRILSEEGQSLELRALCRRANVSRSPIDTLAGQGIVAFEWVDDEHRLERSFAEPEAAPVQLTEEQSEAVAAIAAGLDPARRADFLLHGVTGSGKTEVYLRVVAEAVARGRQAIVLVPEISLTPQIVARFSHRFPRLAVLHSGLTDAERYAQWRAIRSGSADVVVGARSALFAPVPRLGLIVVDEEHETSFKQQNAPRYHARDVAIRRGEIERVPVVLGTATPSLESWRAVTDGRMRLLKMPRRVAGGAFPAVTLVHMGLQGPKAGLFLSEPLRTAVDGALRRGGQAILFLNRRGYHTAILCGRCGEAIQCGRCEIAMTYHRRSNRIICHYCGHEALPPEKCPRCDSRELRYIGSGTERVEAEVRRAFPSARIIRMDSDTMATRNAHDKALELFRRRQADILVGTQMIAKGLDFPSVTLVGVVSADTSLLLPDFRSAERTFQLVAQVAGRAGRGGEGGRVVVQTYKPDHAALRFAAANDFEGFASAELALRKELGYPPFGYLLRALFTAEAESDAVRLAQAAGDALAAAALPEGTTVLGPARAPLSRISGRFRWHLLVKAPGMNGIEAAGAVLARLAREKARAPSSPAGIPGSHMAIDVDPISMA